MYCEFCDRPVLAGSTCRQTGVRHKPIPMVKLLVKRARQPSEHDDDPDNAAASTVGGIVTRLAK